MQAIGRLAFHETEMRRAMLIAAINPEVAMRTKASDVGDWLRQVVDKRDHREVMPDDDYLVLRPGLNFDLLNPAPAQLPVSAHEPDPAGGNRHEVGGHA